MKDWLRIAQADTSKDSLLATLISDAREWCEAYTRRRFINQTWRLLLDFFPGTVDQRLVPTNLSSPFVSGSNAVLVGLRYALVLPYPPLQSISAFTYLDASGGTSTLVANTGYVVSESVPARLTPPFGQFWPVARVVVDAVQVDFVCGYGTDGSAVPSGIKTAIKMLAASAFENPLPDDCGIPTSVKAKLGPFRDLRLP